MFHYSCQFSWEFCCAPCCIVRNLSRRCFCWGASHLSAGHMLWSLLFCFMVFLSLVDFIDYPVFCLCVLYTHFFPCPNRDLEVGQASCQRQNLFSGFRDKRQIVQGIAQNHTHSLCPSLSSSSKNLSQHPLFLPGLSRSILGDRHVSFVLSLDRGFAGRDEGVIIFVSPMAWLLPSVPA